MTMKSGSNGTTLTGRHVLIGFIGFFAVVFTANGIILYEALATRTGIVAEEPYIKGLKYNQRIEADERQAALGWSLDIAVDKDGRRAVAQIRDRNGAPVPSLVTSMNFGRSVNASEDQKIAFSQAGAGRYEAELPVGSAGTYIADIEVSRVGGDEVVFRARRRLWIGQ